MKEPNDGAWVRLCLPRAVSKDTRYPGQGPPGPPPPEGRGEGGAWVHVCGGGVQWGAPHCLPHGPSDDTTGWKKSQV